MSCYDQIHIMEQIKEERRRQDEQWGETDHHPLLWFSIIGEEYGKMLRAFNKYSMEMDQDGVDSASHELAAMKERAISTAASCVAMLECLERVGRKGMVP